MPRLPLDTGEWLSAGVSPDRGRGWRVLAGLLAIGSGTFVVSWFVPLYQSHAGLMNEYEKVAGEASSARSALAAGASAYAEIRQERDVLRRQANAREEQEKRRTERALRIEREIRGKLGGEERRGRLVIGRHDAVVELRFGAGAVQGTGVELTPAAKLALCRVHEALTLTGEVQLRVVGGASPGASPSTPGAAPDWQSAAGRASKAVEVMVGSCGFDAARLTARQAATPVGNAPPPPLSLEIEPVGE